MHSPDYDIFISYRRSLGVTTAQILKSELSHLGYKVFLDTDELQQIGTFDNRILDAIATAPVFLFVYSSGCLDRCAAADDWIAQEIAHAVRTGRIIIPLNEDSALKYYPFPPRGVALPDAVRNGLGQHQFIDFYTGQFKKSSIENLAAGLRDLEPQIRQMKLKSAPPTPRTAVTAADGPAVRILLNRYGEQKLMAVKIVKEAYGISLKEAMETVGAAPVVLPDIDARSAGELISRLESCGCEVRIMKANESAPRKLILKSYGNAKLQLVKYFSVIYGIGLAQAKSLVDRTPVTLPPVDNPDKLRRDLISMGCTVTD